MYSWGVTGSHTVAKRCIGCGRDLEPEFPTCPECGTVQWLGRPGLIAQPTLALLVALVSVVAVGGPILFDLFSRPESSLELEVLGRFRDSERLSGQPQAGMKVGWCVYAQNFGDRVGTLRPNGFLVVHAEESVSIPLIAQEMKVIPERASAVFAYGIDYGSLKPALKVLEDLHGARVGCSLLLEEPRHEKLYPHTMRLRACELELAFMEEIPVRGSPTAPLTRSCPALR